MKVWAVVFSNYYPIEVDSLCGVVAATTPWFTKAEAEQRREELEPSDWRVIEEGVVPQPKARSHAPE